MANGFQVAAYFIPRQSKSAWPKYALHTGHMPKSTTLRISSVLDLYIVDTAFSMFLARMNTREAQSSLTIRVLVLHTIWSRSDQMRFTGSKSDFIEKFETLFRGRAHHEAFHAVAFQLKEDAVCGQEFAMDYFQNS